MNIIKSLVVTFCLILTSGVYAKSVGGVIRVKGKVPNGTLFIFAKRYNGQSPMPLAVKKITTPKYPYRFSLDNRDKMIPSMPFKGPFEVTARISPSGSAMDKSGLQVTTSKPIPLGTQDINLVLIGPSK